MRLAGALSGFIAAFVAVGVAELVAALVGDGRASPLVSVGGSVIDATPRWLKEWAIRSFGTNDKTVLVGTIIAVLVMLALLTGALAVRNTDVGLTGVAVLALVAALSVTTRPGSRSLDAFPALTGGLAGGIALLASPATSASRAACSERQRWPPGQRRRRCPGTTVAPFC